MLIEKVKKFTIQLEDKLGVVSSVMCSYYTNWVMNRGGLSCGVFSFYWTWWSVDVHQFKGLGRSLPEESTSFTGHGGPLTYNQFIGLGRSLPETLLILFLIYVKFKLCLVEPTSKF